MISAIISRLVILVFGTLYPAYASYKAVRTKNLKEYVKWMMYWIVFALFTCTETFTDVFLSWFPFYYEVKIVLVLWLLSPATKGSSFLYRKFVHPALCRREQEIDEYIAKAKDQGYHTVLNLGTKGVNYATTVIMQTAIKGGGGLVQQLRKSYSLSDLSECDPRDERVADEADDVLTEQRVIRRTPKGTRRSASESGSRSMYFPEVDVDVRGRTARDEPDLSHIKSSEDISSGYSSADNSSSLTRTASLGAAARAKRPARTTVTPIKRPQAAEEGDVAIEELYEYEDSFDYVNMPPLVPTSPLFMSDSNPPFLYQYVGEEIKIVKFLGDFPRNFLLNKANDETKSVADSSQPTKDVDETVSKESKQLIIVTQSKDNILSNEPESITANIDIHTEIPDVSKENSKMESTETKSKLELDNSTDELDEVFVESVDIGRDSVESKDFVEAEDFVEAKELSKELNTEMKELSEIKPSEECFNIADIVEPTEMKIENIQKSDLHNVELITLQDIGSSPYCKDSSSLDTLNNTSSLNDSDESDDEASFGTPENSPKSKRKSPKGKYGKGKAPPPPQKIKRMETPTNDDKNLKPDVSRNNSLSTSGENLTDIVNKSPNVIKETGHSNSLYVVNPIAEKKRRHKSKSPVAVKKGNSSGIGKLLQIPSKLAFWNKNDNKDNISTSSGDRSRSSSTAEKAVDEFQSCSNLSALTEDTTTDSYEKSEKDIKDTTDVDDVISQDIMEKSNELKKLIEEKLESHPEYKLVPLHDEIPTISKSTDV